MPPADCSVLIVGGGPCGLMLANEFGRRGVTAVLVDQKATTAFNPQANATQARTMEHFRRLGFAQEIRALGLPSDFPTDIAYFTRYTKHELARFKLPSAREAVERIKQLSGSWSAAELPHRVSQKFVEQVLRRHAEALPGISVHYGFRLTRFSETAQGIEAEIERVSDGATHRIRSTYLVGADGPRSTVRQALGFGYTGEDGAVRDFFGGRMFAIYLRAPDFYRVVPHPPAWMNVTFNRERRAFMAAVDGKGEFAFHTQLRAHEAESEITPDRALAMFQEAVGAPINAEILSYGTWIAGYALVAEKFQRGRVFIAGDAAHLFTPAGGLGYNTAIEDAVNLGWKLAAAIRGKAGPDLLASYEAERQPNARRNTGYARQFADSLGLFVPVPEIEDDTPQGADARRVAGDYLEAHGRAEFNIPGITFGARYYTSPIVAADGTEPPPDAANLYIPSACPGGRAPHLWLSAEQSLYDLFGFEWTLLRLSRGADGQRIITAATDAGLDLTVVDLPLDEARDLYQADLVLIRPDQIVAWRGNSDETAPEIVRRVLGFETSAAPATV
ncbi:FAD-dependent oxidoreductase [Pseudorhodoplanes sinuspersici]|nr:FAD-dependent oxidoreductase [Pseudorhodoplanes sinuspersici]RKE66114.1 2-polyprenyl-6-methoxyphenol hydroxylase-like FAD-dependent oxidoreductase [Pseudorhodoplanes sinuspersici]